MTEAKITLYRGRKANVVAALRRSLDVVPRQGEFIHHEGSLFEIKQVTWDFQKEPPVVVIVGSLNFAPLKL